jgi:dTDP-4-amino-4,6-dideoxygalactose transaminase
VCTDHADIADRVRALRDLGQRRKGEHVALGANERLDGLQAAFLAVKLPRLDAANTARRGHAAAYRDRLAGSVGLLEERPVSPCVYHVFPVRLPMRDAAAARLRARGIGVGLHYTPALNRQPALDGHVRIAGELPNAEAWAAQELSLPMSPGLHAAEIERAAEEVLSCVDR